MEDNIHNQIGDISNISGQVFIGKFENVTANQGISDQSELTKALSALTVAIMASKDLPEEQKQDQVEVIKQIGEEASKPKPNKTLLKILGEGLIGALKAVPDIAGAVAAVAPLLAQLPH